MGLLFVVKGVVIVVAAAAAAAESSVSMAFMPLLYCAIRRTHKGSNTKELLHHGAI